MSIELSAPEVEKLKPRLALLGIGGGGGNALKTMIDCGLKGVDLYAVNTDAQALEEHDQTTRIQIGANITKGLGAGADPKIGKKAAQRRKIPFNKTEIKILYSPCQAEVWPHS